MPPPTYTEDILQEVEFAYNQVPPSNLIPNDYMLVVTLANCWANIGRFDDALTAWESFLRGYPDHALALQGKAKALHSLGRTSEAIDVLAQCHAEWPDLPEPRHVLAQFALDAQLLDIALETVDQAIVLSPQNLDYRKTKLDVLRARRADEDYIEVAKAILELEPKERLVQKELGRKYYATGRYADAIEQLQPLLEVDQEDDDLIEILANSHAGLQHWQVTLDVLRRHSNTKQSLAANALRAEAYHQLGEHGQATKAASRALELAADDEEKAHLSRILGFSLFNIGREREALEALYLLDEDDMDLQTEIVTAICEARLDPGEWRARRLLALSQSHPSYHMLLQEAAWTYLRLNKHQEALSLFARLYEGNPDECGYLVNQIGCLQRIGRGEEAEDLLVENPQCRKLYDSLKR